MTETAPTTPPMAGRIVVVSGGTGGIGKATAAGLAAMGAQVAITGRDRRRAEQAAAETRAADGAEVGVFVADTSSQAEARRLAAELLAALPRIDVLVYDAGGFWQTRQSPPTGWSTPSRPTTWRRSCSPTCSSTG
jgi:NAD(P)-dependent dehydrogenase (short-subunit alcohol dehydrogenase family)